MYQFVSKKLNIIYSRIMQSEESVFKNRDMRFWDYTKEKVLCYFTEKDIAGRLGISTGSVSNAKKALKKAELIECEDIREGFKCITKFYQYISASHCKRTR